MPETFAQIYSALQAVKLKLNGILVSTGFMPCCSAV